MTNLIEILLIVSGIDKTKGDLEKAQSYLKETGAALVLLGTQFERLGAPIREALGMGVDAAADLQEAMSLVSVVFGDNADDITAWAESVRGKLLLSQSELRQWVSRFTILFHNAGLSMEEATVKAQELIVRSTDLALAWNTPGGVVGALEKVEAGLTTTIRPLRAFGVFIDMTTVKAYALAHGIVVASQDMLEMEETAIKVEKAQIKYNEAVEEFGEDALESREALMKLNKANDKYSDAIEGTFETLDQGDKVLARLGLTMEATEKLAGFAVVEQNNWKYVTQELSKVWQDFLAFALTPVINLMVPFVQTLTDWVQKFDELDESVKIGIIAFFGMIAVLGPLLVLAGGLLLAIGALSTALVPLGLTVGGVALAVTGFVVAVGLAAGAIYKYKDEILAFIESVRPIVEEKISGLVTYLETKYAAFQETLKQYNVLWLLAQSGNWEAFAKEMGPMVEQFWENNQSSAETFFEWIKLRNATHASEFEFTWNNLFQHMIHQSQNQLGINQEQWNKWFDAIALIVATLVYSIAISIGATFEWLYAEISNWIDNLDKTYEAWRQDFIRNFEVWRVVTLFRIKQWINDLITTFASIDWGQLARSLIDGFIKGIRDWGWLALNEVQTLASGIRNTIAWTFATASPSKVMEEIGRSIPEGLALGIAQRSGMAELAASRMALRTGREVTNNYYLSANYGYQSPTSLMDDVRMMQLLRG